ncbi:uncharacterized protein LOC119664016, partial [Teleopsis dalmanni]|uniref:uncharacterized protein LOC119664016 n=1 Tax=Teleopsis dalmanni TaxID=139649 RepID=UPI0018CD3EA1
MRPPMQSAALQQNESIIHHHHHQQQQQLPLHQIQLHAKSTALTSASDLNRQQIRKTKFQQREILVENQLNFACSATAAAAVDASPTLPQSNLQTNLVTLHPQTYQQQQSQRLLPNRHNSLANNSIDDEEYDTIQLVDLSTTPPSAEHTFAKFTRRTDFTKRDSAQRSSIISDCQYSRSSSSEDGSLSSERYQSCSRSNIFDDAAEHFIINFPGDSATHNQNDNIVNLPLSETEPLLTNIESALLDKNRAICLRKNSASLIYTKKEQLKTPTTITKYNPPPNPNTIKNNNSTLQTGIVQGTSALNSQQKHLQEQRRHHFSFHSTSESNRKQTKHLPATYYQQQRRSLQLNYNNNLVTTSTCSANNNFSCSSGLETGKISSVLHKNRSNALPAPSIPTATASTSRKQHAYSWYAPVYSALEEELEQDSRDSSPVHNLANIRKHHYQHRSVNTSTSTPDNETVALLETRNQINIQAQLHTEASQDKEKLPRKPISTIQVPDSLPLQNTLNVRTNSLSGSGDFSSVVAPNNYDIEGPHAGSLGLAGGPLPPRKRIKNFFKSLVGLKSSNGRSGGNATNSFSVDSTSAAVTLQRPVSPEIRITRTPSEQNLVVIRTPTGRQIETYKSSEKLVNGVTQGSTSSLNVVQQKIRNILRREDSVSSLNHEKSQSVVQYKGLRKCETMVALTRQASLCSPVLGETQTDVAGTHRTSSGIFNANGVEQIRPLNRLRTSATSINMTCSRCSSLLSLAASTSRYSLNVASTSGVSFANPTSNCVPLIQKSTNHHPQELQELFRGNIKNFRNFDSSHGNSHDSMVENVPSNIGT